MPSIINFIQDISSSYPDNQSINVRATSPWLNALAAQFTIVNTIAATLLSGKKGGRIILRGDVKNSASVEERIVRALIWAYPSGMHNHYDSDILNQLLNLSAVLRNVQGRNLDPTDFHQLYNEVTAFRGIGHRTASILLFYFNVRHNNIPCEAVTRYVIRAFADIDEFIQLNANNTYVDMITTINSVATQHGVTAEQIEFFLFNHGKRLTQQAIAVKKAQKKAEKKKANKN